MNEKLIRPIFRFFNNKTKNAEFYKNHGSVWLIFTKEKRWVFELTKEGTLWYNYYLFNDVFKYFSLDVVKNQDYITKWVENIIQNGVKETFLVEGTRIGIVENTIQIGVKDTFDTEFMPKVMVEDTIQNGVKETKHNPFEDGLAMEEAIQNGIKQTCGHGFNQLQFIEDTIQNGIKHTEYGDWLDGDERLDDIIENGVKETNMEEHHRLREVVQTVKNGIKETKYCELHSLMRADHIIRDGIKETHWKRVDNYPTFVDKIIEITNPS